MITYKNLEASANRARALASELWNIHAALCTPYGAPVSIKEVATLADQVDKVSSALENLANEYKQRTQVQEGQNGARK